MTQLVLQETIRSRSELVTTELVVTKHASTNTNTHALLCSGAQACQTGSDLLTPLDSPQPINPSLVTTFVCSNCKRCFAAGSPVSPPTPSSQGKERSSPAAPSASTGSNSSWKQLLTWHEWSGSKGSETSGPQPLVIGCDVSGSGGSGKSDPHCQGTPADLNQQGQPEELFQCSEGQQQQQVWLQEQQQLIQHQQLDAQPEELSPCSEGQQQQQMIQHQQLVPGQQHLIQQQSGVEQRLSSPVLQRLMELEESKDSQLRWELLTSSSQRLAFFFP